MVEETTVVMDDEETRARLALETARDEETKAYRQVKEAILTPQQETAIELAELGETETDESDQMEKRCILLLNSYCLGEISHAGGSVKLADSFTRFDEPERDYIEAVITDAAGKKKTVGYNFKPDPDGKSLILFEKTFENIVLEEGKPEKYVLYDKDGSTVLASYSLEELEEKISAKEVVKVDDHYYRKALDEDGQVREGVEDVFTTEGNENGFQTILGNNEQERYSLSKEGQLLKAVTNDVTTVSYVTRKLNGSGPEFETEQEARDAAQRELKEGETHLKVDVAMAGTSIAEFNFVPTFTTSVELTGMSKKVGRGVEGYDPSVSDEENFRRQFAQPICAYLQEKGYYVIDITLENLQADIKETVGFMSTMKTYQITAGTLLVTYIKVYNETVTIKQGLLGGRGQKNTDTEAILAQLPKNSELLKPEEIDRKSSRTTVAYVMRGEVTGSASAKTVEEADQAAASNAITEAQKVAVKGLNGGIPAGIREVIAASGAVSTVTNVRVRMDVPAVTKNDMKITRENPKYAYSGTCDKEVMSVSNQLISVTTWDADQLTYVEPTDPVIDRGIPTDENYDRYVNEGDESGILLFEKTDIGLQKYIQDAKDAQARAAQAKEDFEKARKALAEAQAAFDKFYE